ncbi:hypothetical protein E2562_016484 [Oryza meyeriana var. granulata]|uniref:Uncharacterized protein n=1 Tax=Oryza meyeriana var. granulata TaxID=110450 RepID=A0A6G1BKW3_9ORYZ|nr:hypothetical protein E2562_016484 [Oryza meyeriana var. granulata]
MEKEEAEMTLSLPTADVEATTSLTVATSFHLHHFQMTRMAESLVPPAKSWNLHHAKKEKKCVAAVETNATEKSSPTAEAG